MPPFLFRHYVAVVLLPHHALVAVQWLMPCLHLLVGEWFGLVLGSRPLSYLSSGIDTKSNRTSPKSSKVRLALRLFQIG
nr:MAG TPA: hypothetical protein [Caudoviricetes sp.]